MDVDVGLDWDVDVGVDVGVDVDKASPLVHSTARCTTCSTPLASRRHDWPSGVSARRDRGANKATRAHRGGWGLTNTDHDLRQLPAQFHTICSVFLPCVVDADMDVVV